MIDPPRRALYGRCTGCLAVYRWTILASGPNRGRSHYQARCSECSTDEPLAIIRVTTYQKAPGLTKRGAPRFR